MADTFSLPGVHFDRVHPSALMYAHAYRKAMRSAGLVYNPRTHARTLVWLRALSRALQLEYEDIYTQEPNDIVELLTHVPHASRRNMLSAASKVFCRLYGTQFPEAAHAWNQAARALDARKSHTKRQRS